MFCPSIFKLKIQDAADKQLGEFRIECFVNGYTGHKLYGNKYQFRGSKREVLANEILRHGTSVVRDDMIDQSTHDLNQFVPTSNMLRKVKFDALHIMRISSDVLKDTMSLKNSFNLNCFDDKNDNFISGYIQDINADPYGFLLMSRIQVS